MRGEAPDLELLSWGTVHMISIKVESREPQAWLSSRLRPLLLFSLSVEATNSYAHTIKFSMNKNGVSEGTSTQTMVTISVGA